MNRNYRETHIYQETVSTVEIVLFFCKASLESGSCIVNSLWKNQWDFVKPTDIMQNDSPPWKYDAVEILRDVKQDNKSNDSNDELIAILKEHAEAKGWLTNPATNNFGILNIPIGEELSDYNTLNNGRQRSVVFQLWVFQLWAHCIGIHDKFEKRTKPTFDQLEQLKAIGISFHQSDIKWMKIERQSRSHAKSVAYANKRFSKKPRQANSFFV